MSLESELRRFLKCVDNIADDTASYLTDENILPNTQSEALANRLADLACDARGLLTDLENQSLIA